MSDGRFSSKPLRSERSRDVGEFSAEAILSTDAARAFLQSPSVQRDVNALRNLSFPDIGHLRSAPLHKRTPAAALDLGRPIASATLAQEYLIGLIFLRVAGWMFLAFGVLFLFGAVGMVVSTAINNANQLDPAPSVCLGGLALGLIAVGAWFGFFRGRVINEMCWFCPRGMIWMTEGIFEWYQWEDVPEVYCNLQGDRPAIGISLGRNVSWISFSNTHASRGLVDYIEKRASAACMAAILPRLADGKTIRFGAWRLSRTSIRSADIDIAWANVLAVACQQREIWIKQQEGSTTVPLDEIPFPSMFTTFALAIYGHGRE